MHGHGIVKGVVPVDEPDVEVLPLQQNQGAAFHGAAPGTGEGTGVEKEPRPVGAEVGHVGVTVERQLKAHSPDLFLEQQGAVLDFFKVAVGAENACISGFYKLV